MVDSHFPGTARRVAEFGTLAHNILAATLDYPKVTEPTTPEAFDSLESWIRRSPSERSLWTLDRTGGKWRVGLTTGSERLSAGVGETLAAAARAAMAIADAAGYL